MPSRVDRVPAIWLVVGSILSVQVGAAFAKGLFETVPPLAVAWLRLTGGAVVLVPLVRPWRALPRRGEPGAGRRWWLLVAFVVAMLGMNISIYLALSRIPMGIAITLEFLGPLGVAVAGSRRMRDVVWVVLAGAGVVLLGLGPVSFDLVGIGFALIAAACWAGYIVIGSRTAGAWRPVDLLAITCAVGCVGLLPVAAAIGGPGLLAPRALATGLLVGLMSTVVPYSLELSAMKRIPQATFGILMSVEPAMAALAGLVVLGEALGMLDVAAMACVIIASIGSARSRRAPTG